VCCDKKGIAARYRVTGVAESRNVFQNFNRLCGFLCVLRVSVVLGLRGCAQPPYPLIKGDRGTRLHSRLQENFEMKMLPFLLFILFRSRRLLCIGGLLLLLLSGAFAVDALVTPGAAVCIAAPKAGKTFLVYVPVDYTDKRPWPIIFCYHGYGGSATTWPFKQVTRGKGFIIVGMNYVTQLYYKGLRPSETEAEKAFFHETLSLISENLNVAKDYIFMGGIARVAILQRFWASNCWSSWLVDWFWARAGAMWI